jgi:hypothetical protein
MKVFRGSLDTGRPEKASAIARITGLLPKNSCVAFAERLEARVAQEEKR